MRLQKRSASTFVAQSAISQISERDLMLLRETARIAPSRRARMDPHSHATHTTVRIDIQPRANLFTSLRARSTSSFSTTLSAPQTARRISGP